jgi:hypothetical protein
MIVSPEHINVKLIRHVGTQQQAAARLRNDPSEPLGAGAPNSFVAKQLEPKPALVLSQRDERGFYKLRY